LIFEEVFKIENCSFFAKKHLICKKVLKLKILCFFELRCTKLCVVLQLDFIKKMALKIENWVFSKRQLILQRKGVENSMFLEEFLDFAESLLTIGNWVFLEKALT
jgi:hypothetical protein